MSHPFHRTRHDGRCGRRLYLYDHAVLNFLLGVLATVLLGVVVDLLSGGVSRLLHMLRTVWTQKTAISADIRQDGLYVLGEWSPNRRLDPSRLITRFVPLAERPMQGWVDSTLLDREVAACRDTGDISYITSFAIDHRESRETQHCRVTISESSYAEVRALEQMRISQPEKLADADSAVERNATAYLASALPSSVAVNIVVVGDGLRILRARRSAAVHNAIGLWTVGVFETMKRSDPNTPGHIEDFYGLASRGLEEELNLRAEDYGEIHLTWFGLYRPIFRGHLVAITRATIPVQEVIEHARQSSSSYEHEAFEWMPLRRAKIREFCEAPLQHRDSRAGQTIMIDGREYIEQSRLALLEAWRFRLMVDA